MKTPLALSIKGDFAFITGMIETMIDVCPETLWNKKAGGFVFWQQLLHAVASVNFFIMHEGYVPPTVNQPDDVLHLKAVPATIMSKAELKDVVAQIRKQADAFLDSVTEERLAAKHEALSQYFGRDCSYQESLLKLLWHTSYHLGCCDSLLREEGIPGVF